MATTKKDGAKSICCPPEFPYHGKELARINRAIGQLEGAKRMIEEKRYCPDILTLLRGSRAAVKAVEGNILETYLNSCVRNAFASDDPTDQQKKIEELKEIFKRYEE